MSPVQWSRVEAHAWRRSFWSAFLIGAGLMAAVDEIIFHQLLAWHHFYDRATPFIGLVSDGLLHSAELVALVTGFFLFSVQRRSGNLIPLWAWSGAFLGAGIFQVFDGLINHKVLRLHQIRYGVDNILPYDVAWNAFGALLILIGLVLLMHARRSRLSE